MIDYSKFQDLFEANDFEEFKKEVSKIKDINDQDEEDGFNLMLNLSLVYGNATEMEKFKFFEYLVNCGAKLDVTDAMGRTPLGNFAFEDNVAFTKLMIDLGADVNYRGEDRQVTAVYRAAKSNAVNTLKYLLGVNGIDLSLKPWGYSISQYAKKGGAKPCIALLKEMGIK